MANEKMVEVRDLTIGYGERVVMEKLNFSIAPGEIVCIMGGSGCGKSTLLKHLIGLYEPMKGDIFIRNRSIVTASEKEKKEIMRSFGVTYQGGALFGSMSVAENVELPLIYQNVKRAERVERVKSALERVGLSKRAKHLPTELSGGQQQRVAIARAIVTNPKLILADEPTGALDSKTSQEIMDIFHELHEQGNTIVLITHDNDVAKQASRSIHILDGKTTEVKL